ncbi:MAG: SAM-dependent methyltransferase [Lachnospiraceae bacterium]|nr:SAM-dependent methyltransferase [Lachnospiraceae bacterium]
MITLSKRLQAIADLVEPCRVVADIGCDHGFLSIRLVEDGKAEHVIASDVNEGPIKRAREHIHTEGLDDRIETIQCDGLSGIMADTVIIAGMGGNLMLKILRDSPESVGNATAFVLQPQSELKAFRESLQELGLAITAEDLVIEDGKYYPMMQVRHGRMDLNELQALYGPVLLAKKHPGLREYLLYQNQYLKELLNTLRAQTGERSRERLQEVEKELVMNEAALHEWMENTA